MNKKKYLFLSFVLLLFIISGCSKISSSHITSNTNNEVINSTQIVNENPEQIESELDDSSLDELDNIDLSNW